MGPDDMKFDRSDIIRIKNVDDEDFHYRYEAKDYLVKKGETLLMPGGMANHFVYHFVNHMMIKDNKTLQMREVDARKEYIDKVFLGIEKSAAMIESVESPSERAEREFNELNTPAEDLTAPSMTEEEAEKELPKDEELYPDPKADEEEAFPELNSNGSVSDKVQKKSGDGNRGKDKGRTKK